MSTFATRVQFLDDTDPFSSTNFPEPATRPPTFTFLTNVPVINQISGVHKILGAPHKLEDCALQLYKCNSSGQGDYGVYLDLESTIDDQWEELEGLNEQRKNSIVLRTQLSVRVHAIIEKLLNSDGRELRRALFSLKQIFQDDKDLVHEFVTSDGLDCLIKVGSEADQNHQNYILRALGQVMLYVDGMNGVITHNETVRWLYALVSSKFRLVAKTALKLLLVFVEYTQSNAQHVLQAVHAVDNSRGVMPFRNVMDVLEEKDGGDSELSLFAMTLINKTLSAIPDQDTFYDVTDYLEEQGMENLIRKHMSKKGTDLDLVTQLNIYEASLKQEDGEYDDDSKLSQEIRQLPRVKSESDTRKSRRISHGQPGSPSPNMASSPNLQRHQSLMEERLSPPPAQRSTAPSASPAQKSSPEPQSFNKSDDQPMSYLERRRAERAARKERESAEPEESKKPGRAYSSRKQAMRPEIVEGGAAEQERPKSLYERALESKQGKNTTDTGKRDSGYDSWRSDRGKPDQGDITSPLTPGVMSNNRRWMLYKMTKQSSDDILEAKDTKEKPDIKQSLSSRIDNLNQKPEVVTPTSPQKPGDSQVTSLADKLIAGDAMSSATSTKPGLRVGDTSGSIAAMRDKLGLVPGSPATVQAVAAAGRAAPAATPPTDIDNRWEAIERAARRRLLVIKDLDFTDLTELDDVDVLQPVALSCSTNGLPNGIPPMPPGAPPLPFGAPPLPFGAPPLPFAPPFGPPPPPGVPAGPPLPPGQSGGLKKTDSSKQKKTVRLHWREVHDKVHIPNPTPDIAKQGTIWQKIKPTEIDINKFEHLFESRGTELKAKKQTDSTKKLVTVLDSKRSNAINIGLTKLPPARTIKAAILKMDSSIINREGIEKILSTMIPTDEEKQKIIEAQTENPDVPLGTAEQLLLTMASIAELVPRMHLWAFKLDYDQNEKEIAEPLGDLKEGIAALYLSKTFKNLLATLLSIGNFLNGACNVGFHIEYLAKVPEVKDTVHKHSLLHHLCVTMSETCPDSTDLYSEISSIARCARVDWDELSDKLRKLEEGCREAMDNLVKVAKHESYTSQNLRVKLSEFLSDCAERIVVLKIVHNRMIHRYYKLLLYLGITANDCKELKVHQFCKIVSEFALEYRTTREKVIVQNAKKKSYKERKKTRGKLIVDVDTNNFGKSPQEVKQQDEQLTSILTNGVTSEPIPRKKKESQLQSIKKAAGGGNTEAEDTGDDELLESAFRSAATAGPRQRTERKRSQYRHRKSLRRTLRGGILDEDGNRLDVLLTTVNLKQ